jgi:hypothetical protein
MGACDNYKRIITRARDARSTNGQNNRKQPLSSGGAGLHKHYGIDILPRLKAWDSYGAQERH